jgi:hypothetical protein
LFICLDHVHFQTPRTIPFIRYNWSFFCFPLICYGWKDCFRADGMAFTRQQKVWQAALSWLVCLRPWWIDMIWLDYRCWFCQARIVPDRFLAHANPYWRQKYRICLLRVEFFSFNSLRFVSFVLGVFLWGREGCLNLRIGTREEEKKDLCTQVLCSELKMVFIEFQLWMESLIYPGEHIR